MGKAKIILCKINNINIFVGVELTVEVSALKKVTSKLQDHPQYLKLPNGTWHQTFLSAECACFSGAFFALRKIGVENYHICIETVFGSIGQFDSDGFAIAAFTGVAFLLDKMEVVSNEVLEDWELVEVDRIN